jgi:hypothetical protein
VVFFISIFLRFKAGSVVSKKVAISLLSLLNFGIVG